ncbi:hypothetical protein DLREEDagrD3_05690 [Denitratisoma sp. agr-D3]
MPSFKPQLSAVITILVIALAAAIALPSLAGTPEKGLIEQR